MGILKDPPISMKPEDYRKYWFKIELLPGVTSSESSSKSTNKESCGLIDHRTDELNL